MGLRLALRDPDQDSRAMFLRVLIFALVLVGQPVRGELLVFAAASLKEPIDQLEAEMTDVTVTYAGSGTLARQVSLGAPADLVLLANDDWMQFLISQRHVQAETVVDFASNRLVFVAARDTGDLSLELSVTQKKLGTGRIAGGLTNAVPAGIYAKAALENLGLWQGLNAQLAEVDNVRAALALVARGQTPLGIVYQTDVRISADIRQVAIFPQDSHPPIRYRAALASSAQAEAVDFLTLLIAPTGQSLLEQAGFFPPLEVEE